MEIMMNNIFSYKLYLQGLRKIRVVGFAMLFLVTALNAASAVTMVVAPPGCVIMPFRLVECAPFSLLVGVFAPLLVYSMFSFLNERRASDFFHSLPQKRACIYTSFMAAVMTWIVSAILLTTLVNEVIFAWKGVYVPPLAQLAPFIFGCLIFAMAMAGFMALAMTVTGTTIANVFVFCICVFFVRACGACFLDAFAEEAPMFVSEYSALRFLDWDFFLPVALFNMDMDSSSFTDPLPLLLYWLFVAVALFFAAAVCYCHRRSESASKAAPNRFVHALYLVCLILPFLIMGVEVFRRGGEIHLLFILTGFLAWVIFEALTTKKVKNIVRSLPLLLIPAVLTGGYVASVSLAKTVFYASTPKREEIVSVKVEKFSNLWSTDDELSQKTQGFANAILSTSQIKDSAVLDEAHEMIELMKKSEPHFGGSFYTDAVITFTLKTGRTVTYNLHPYNAIDDTFFYSEEFRAYLSAFDFDIRRVESDFSDEKSAALCEAFKADFNALSDEQMQMYLVRNKQQTLGGKNILKIYGTYNGVGFRQVVNPIKEYTPNAYRLYNECLAEQAEALLEDLADVVCELETMKASKIYSAQMKVSLPYNSSVVDCRNLTVIKAFLTQIPIDSHLIDYENAGDDAIRFMTLSIHWADEEGNEQAIEFDGAFTFSPADKRIYSDMTGRIFP